MNTIVITIVLLLYVLTRLTIRLFVCVLSLFLFKYQTRVDQDVSIAVWWNVHCLYKAYQYQFLHSIAVVKLYMSCTWMERADFMWPATQCDITLKTSRFLLSNDQKDVYRELDNDVYESISRKKFNYFFHCFEDSSLYIETCSCCSRLVIVV